MIAAYENQQTKSDDHSILVGDRCNKRFQYPSVKVRNGIEMFGANPADTRGISEADYPKVLEKFRQDALRLKYVPDRGPDPSNPRFIELAMKNAQSQKCQGMDPAVFHTILANQLGRMQEGFAMDKIRDLEVWNQPIFKFESKVLERSANQVHIKTYVYYADDTNYGWAYHFPTFLGLFSFKDELDQYSNALLREGDITEPLRYPEGIIDRSEYEYLLNLNDAQEIVSGSWISFDRPDLLWIEKPRVFSGPFRDLHKIYHAIEVPMNQKPAI